MSTFDGRTLTVTVEVRLAGSSDPWVSWPFVSGSFEEDVDRVPFALGTLVCTPPTGADIYDQTWYDVTRLLAVRLTVGWSGLPAQQWSLIARASDADLIAGTVSLTVGSTDLLLLRPAPQFVTGSVFAVGAELDRLASTAYFLGSLGQHVIVPTPDFVPNGGYASWYWESTSPPSSGMEYVTAMTQSAGCVFRCQRDGNWTVTARRDSSPPTVVLSTAQATFDNFNAELAGMTFAQFNTQFAGYTFGQFNAYMRSKYGDGTIKAAQVGTDLDPWANVVALHWDDGTDYGIDSTGKVAAYDVSRGVWATRTDNGAAWSTASEPVAVSRGVSLLGRLKRNGTAMEFLAVLDPAVTAGTWARFYVRDRTFDRQIAAITYDLDQGDMRLVCRPRTE